MICCLIERNVLKWFGRRSVFLASTVASGFKILILNRIKQILKALSIRVLKKIDCNF